MIRSEKELLHIPAYIWTGVSVIGAGIYCFNFTDSQEQYLAKLTAAVVVCGVYGHKPIWKNMALYSNIAICSIIVV